MLTSLPVLIITRCKAPTAWPAWAGDVGRLVARCACVAAGGPSAMGSCPVVQQLYGRLDAVGEELIGQVAVCARPGELQRAEHQSEEGQRVGLGRFGVGRVETRRYVVDDAHQFIGVDLFGGGGGGG